MDPVHVARPHGVTHVVVGGAAALGGGQYQATASITGTFRDFFMGCCMWISDGTTARRRAGEGVACWGVRR
jgi:hypothetical protein